MIRVDTTKPIDTHIMGMVQNRLTRYKLTVTNWPISMTWCVVREKTPIYAPRATHHVAMDGYIARKVSTNFHSFVNQAILWSNYDRAINRNILY